MQIALSTSYEHLTKQITAVSEASDKLDGIRAFLTVRENMGRPVETESLCGPFGIRNDIEEVMGTLTAAYTELLIAIGEIDPTE